MIWAVLALAVAFLLLAIGVFRLDTRLNEVERYLAREKRTLKKVIRRLK